MAERVVKISLILEAQGYMQGAEAAAKKTRELGSETEKLAQKKEAFNTLGTAALGFGAAVAAGVALAVSKFMEFDAQMSAVQAATHETESNMDLLRDAAIDAGARTVYSATEAAQAIEELSKAGISTANVLDGALDGALDLAAAGNIAVADAAEIAASAMTQFSLSGREVGHIADLLAAGAGKAQGGVEEMSQALNQSGLVAAQMGLSLDETVGTLTQFASAGLLGSDAGTSFRNMLLRLANPTGEAASQMEQLGLEFYNAQGEFIGMEGVASQLQTQLKGLTQEERNAALANLFGQDAIRAASILYEGGADSVRKWADEVNDAGYASETAATRLDNLKGDWEAFTGALDSALITMGEGADGPLRDFVQTLTDMTNSFNAAPDWAQQSALGVGALVGAVALGSGAFMLAVPKVQQYRDALTTMGTGAQRAGEFIGTAAKIAGAAVGFVALTIAVSKTAEAFGAASAGAKGYQETLKLVLDQDYDAPFSGLSSDVSDLDSALELLLGGSLNSNMERFGSSLNSIVAGGSLADQVSETREQFTLLGESLAEMVNQGDADQAADAFREIAKAAEAQGFSVDEVNALMPAYQEALDGVTNSSTLAGDASAGAAGDIAGMGDSAEESKEQLDGLREALENVGRTALDMGDAQDAAQSAINRMVEAADAEEVSITGTNNASIALRDSLREVEESHRVSAEAMIDNGLSADEATAAYYRGRDALLDQIQGFFASREEAAAWADANLGSAALTEQALRDVAWQVQNMPTPAPINLSVTGTSEVYDELMRVQGALREVTGNRSLHVATGPGGGGGLVAGNAVGNLYDYQSFASGGFASGIYSGQSGSIHKFAEPWLPWETYISGDPGQSKRNVKIWQETGQRLGVLQQPSISGATSMGAASSVSGERPIEVNTTINAQPGMSESQVGRIAEERVSFALRGH